ncbi:MAG TPA: DNA-processing protein DprA, partial [Fimbriimonadaceae bacterium]|nr:DNA-processing protein DprA [Fimbriimonadaceae bacterium]
MLPPSFWQALGVAGVSRHLAQSIVGTLRQDYTLNPLATLRAWPNLPAEALKRLNQADLGLADRALQQGGWVLEASEYPESLREMESPPLCLFGRGAVDVLREPMVAIVGTRKASSYGLAVAEFFGKGLAEQGFTVLSGGALGIDAQAHKGA